MCCLEWYVKWNHIYLLIIYVYRSLDKLILFSKYTRIVILYNIISTVLIWFLISNNILLAFCIPLNYNLLYIFIITIVLNHTRWSIVLYLYNNTKWSIFLYNFFYQGIAVIETITGSITNVYTPMLHKTERNHNNLNILYLCIF